MSYAEIYKMPLPKFLYMVRFLDPTGILSLLQGFGMKDGQPEDQTRTEKESLLPDLATSDGQAEYEAMLDAALAKGNV